jgi:signal transduction histidine kinase
MKHEQKLTIPKSVLDAVLYQGKVDEPPHNFYRYPARFAPSFAREVIREFSTEGDVVLDPFCGGGTTLLEAMKLGRRAAGTDVSTLATFIARAKTTPLSIHDRRAIELWCKGIAAESTFRCVKSGRLAEHDRKHYERNVPGRATAFFSWVISRIARLEKLRQQAFVRLILLSVGQWALDCKTTTPDAAALRLEFLARLREAIGNYMQFLSGVAELNRLPRCRLGSLRRVINRDSREINLDGRIPRSWLPAKLVVTASINSALNRLGRTSSKFLNEKSGTHATEEESQNNYGDLLKQLEEILSVSEATRQRFEQHAKDRLYGLRQIEGATRMIFLNLKESEAQRAKAKQLLDTVERLQTDLAADDSEIEKLTKSLSGNKKLTAIIRHRIDDFQERSQLLYEMVGVGLSAQALAHDVPAMLHQLEDEVNSLVKLNKAKKLDQDKIIAGADSVKTSLGAVEQMVDFVRPMLRGRRLSRRRAPVSEFLRAFFELRGARLKTRGINWFVETEGAHDFEILFNPGRFTQILDNLTTNSEYWIEHHFGSDSKEGRINLELRDPELVFYDNGKGIRPDLEESLFELFVSGREGDEGNGLGLFITRQLLLRDNCTIYIDSARNEHKRLYRFAINFSGVKK